ncbi:low-density lipoprotein receptor-related protein 1-like, partial [Tachysurus ichikawai]
MTAKVNLICHQSHVSQCPPNEYECRGTDVCIHLSKVCNGISDCVDGRDEGHHCL